MKKQIIATLLIASIAISGIFAAYSSPDVILTTTKEAVDYNFKLVDYTADSSYASGDLTKTVTLSTTANTTAAFALATTANGNLASDIEFEVSVATGEFLDEDVTGTAGQSGWFPVLVNDALSATTKNATLFTQNEVVTYAPVSVGDYDSSNTAKFTTPFVRGKHVANTEVARFKLSYKADDNLIAGNYKSTTTITIATN